jgi:CDGSH-type Zn-finger protein
MSKDDKKITVSKNGPYLVSGDIPLGMETIVCDDNDVPVKWGKGKSFPLKETYALCRCGQSRTKPFCDGSHIAAKFDGTETASRKPYLEQAERTIGPGLDLTDCEDLCAIARFCHRSGDTWTLTEDSADPKARQTAIEEACDCPSGRLLAWDKKTGKPIEPNFTPSISLVEDSCKKVSGPLRVKGGIPVISSDATQYEVRNRVTLCRCGASKNKPFCDGAHCSVGFSDGVI